MTEGPDSFLRVARATWHPLLTDATNEQRENKIFVYITLTIIQPQIPEVL